MAKNKHKGADLKVIESAPIEDQSEESPSSSEIADVELVVAHPDGITMNPDDEYKSKNNIPMDAMLARSREQLPRYFRQNDQVFVTEALPEGMQFGTPIWFHLITAPADVEALEAYYIARRMVTGRGYKLGN